MSANDKFNIIYLFGAGASIGNNNYKERPTNEKLSNNQHIRLEYLKNKITLNMPLANSFVDTIDDIRFLLMSKLGVNTYDEINIDNYSTLHQFLIRLDTLKAFISKNRTVDEGMRSLLFNNDPTFELLKNTIAAIFFTIESSFACFPKDFENISNGYRDSRYTQFLLTVSEKEFQLPNSIFIYSWNYDNQFELAVNEIMAKNKEYLNSNNYIKLNGKIEIELDKYYYRNINVYQEQLQLIFDKKESDIKFAWEEELEKQPHLQIKNSKPNIFVIIGYSLPYVNHLVDMNLFKINPPSKIYYQDPSEENYQHFSGKFYQYDIKHIKNTNTFYIPPELHEGYVLGAGLYNFKRIKP